MSVFRAKNLFFRANLVNAGKLSWGPPAHADCRFSSCERPSKRQDIIEIYFELLLDWAKLCGSVDVTEERLRHALPTVTGVAAKLTLAVLKKRNVAVAPLLQRAGLSDRDFDGPQHRISAASQAKFLELAAEAVDDSAFGLHLAEDANPREEGLLFYVTSAAPNIREALSLFARYSRIANEAVRIKHAQAQEGLIAEFSFIGLSRYAAKQATEFGVGVMIQALREVAGRSVRPMHVRFAHSRSTNLRAFEQFFGCPVEFGASGDQVAFSNETLALPLVTEDRYLLETLRPLCDEAAKERGTASGSLRAAVENEAQKLLPHGKAKKHMVAKSLGHSERTLARRLVDEGTTYEEVLDQLRESLALQYIKEGGVSLKQIAWLLGYEGPTSFNQAFKRWTGRAPSAARSERLLHASV
jgi:AraC-like DNA-binding protein